MIINKEEVTTMEIKKKIENEEKNEWPAYKMKQKIKRKVKEKKKKRRKGDNMGVLWNDTLLFF